MNSCDRHFKIIQNPQYIAELNQKYRYIYILDDRNFFETIKNEYRKDVDLILTFDLALKKQIDNSGGNSRYIDQIYDQTTMHSLNFVFYDYFKNWNLDKNGTDIFSYLGLDFGFIFRQELWNDMTFLTRIWFCFTFFDSVKYEGIKLGTEEVTLKRILDNKELKYTEIFKTTPAQFSAYYFPIQKWMDNAITPKGLRATIRKVFFSTLPWIFSFLENLNPVKRTKVFIQKYHPTFSIIGALKTKQLDIILEGFTTFNLSNILSEKQIPLKRLQPHYSKSAELLISRFKQEQFHVLSLQGGGNFHELMTQTILNRIRPRLSYYLCVLDSVNSYFANKKLRLEVMIANIGIINGAVDAYCKKNKIPSYMIINGMLYNEYLDESKYATLINSYSNSIKTNYFRGMENIVVMGDPRMDVYATAKPNQINRIRPTITIGASGFNNIDFNSFVAVEFEFLHEVLEVLKVKKLERPNTEIILKVRANGYVHLYNDFITEYFPDLGIKVIAKTPMIEVLKKTDLYISIYSQTLFEASCLGIPVIYHKYDNEVMDPPFNQKSELVTTTSKHELSLAYESFLKENSMYSSFLSKSVMENYIGPLDGKNLSRNLEVIERFLNDV